MGLVGRGTGRMGPALVGLALLAATCGDVAPEPMAALPTVAGAEAAVAVGWEPPSEPVRASPGRPLVPPEVRASAGGREGEPELRLVAVARGAADWADHRALIEDTATGDVRAYAVGDLLPRGGVLTSIDDGAITLMTASSVLLRLEPATPPTVVEDLSTARVRWPRFRSTASAARANLARVSVEAAVLDLGSPDAARVEAAVEALLRAGESIVPALLEHVSDPRPVGVATVDLRGRPTRAATCGDRVITVLEEITGLGFGDPGRGRRAEVVEAWRAWGGL